MPIALPISDRNVIIHIVNTVEMKYWNFCMDNSEIEIWRAGAGWQIIVLQHQTSDQERVASRGQLRARANVVFSIIIHDSGKLTAAQDHT